LEGALGRSLSPAGKDARGSKHSDHLGVVPQKQPGLCAVGLAVPVGRISAAQLLELARISEHYGTADVRITTGQNVIVPNIPSASLALLMKEPLLGELSCDPHGAVRGLVSCTGIDYCHFALIETKELAVKTARHLQQRLPKRAAFTTHWSGCPAGCGNHALADIGLLGKNIRIDGQLVDAVDVYIGGRTGTNTRPGTKVLEDVPCDDLPEVLERIVPYVTKKKLSTANLTDAAAAAPPATPVAKVGARLRSSP
jgi:ferredoxin-nitrite reductase